MLPLFLFLFFVCVCVRFFFWELILPCSFSVPRGLSAGKVYQVFPVHDQDSLKRLQGLWVSRVFSKQPIGKSEESPQDVTNGSLKGRDKLVVR